jgi:hypothetical protein
MVAMKKTIVEEFDNEGKLLKRTTIEESPIGEYKPVPYLPQYPYQPDRLRYDPAMILGEPLKIIW